MNQRTHAWIAIRTVALLEDSGETPGLVRLLKPHLKSTAMGAWIPDLQDSRRGSGDVDNHVLKMKPCGDARYVLGEQELLDKLGPQRAMTAFVRDEANLDTNWWAQPYKAEPQPGQHLANRSMALATTIIDLLILGDPSVGRLLPGTVSFAGELYPGARSSKEQIATIFFMLSHFVADSCMPCHCDARKLSSYGAGLHKELEKHWSRLVGTTFDKAKLEASEASPAALLKEARRVDDRFGVERDAAIPPLVSRDAWAEMLYVCRGSFAVASRLAPPEKYSYRSRKSAPYDTVFAGTEGEHLLSSLDAMVAHDAVLNTAMVWKDVWATFPED